LGEKGKSGFARNSPARRSLALPPQINAETPLVNAYIDDNISNYYNFSKSFSHSLLLLRLRLYRAPARFGSACAAACPFRFIARCGSIGNRADQPNRH
jgi:hypothetical protein